MQKRLLASGIIVLVAGVIIGAAGYFVPVGYLQSLVAGASTTVIGLGLAVLVVNYYFSASDKRAAAIPLLKLIDPNVTELHNALFVGHWTDRFGTAKATDLIRIYQTNRRNPRAFSPEQCSEIHSVILDKKDELLRVHELLGEQFRELATMTGWSFDPMVTGTSLEARLNFVTFKAVCDKSDIDSKYKLVEAYLDGEAAATGTYDLLARHLGMKRADWLEGYVEGKDGF